MVYSDMESYLHKFRLCFQKCKEYGISLNLDKCAFMVFSREVLGFIVSKKGKLLDPKKIQSIVNMPPPKNPQQIEIFNGMAQFYRCFIKKIVAIMAPIIKLTKKIETFLWTKECQQAWKLIIHKYIETLVLISPNWQVEFHVHTYASLLIVGAMLFQNVIGKNDQPIVYVFRLLNRA